MIYENLFLIALALAWIFAAVINDFKKREIPNWLNFSLIIFALAYRAFYSVFSSDLWFFLWGLIGLGVFFLVSEAFYYGRVFGGGDAKLLMALGTVLLFSSTLWGNFLIFLVFIFLLLLTGSLYSLFYSFVLIRKNSKFYPEFLRQLKEKKNLFLISLIFFAVSFVLVYNFQERIFYFFPIIILIFPFLYVYAKAVEESCFVVRLPASRLTVGDWLYEDIKVKGKLIRADWQGLSEEELSLLKKYRGKIKIKQGVPFAIAFLFAFFALLILGYFRFGIFI